MIIILKKYLRDKLDSTILTSNLKTELIKVCEFERNTKWTLFHRGSRDGFGANMFHAKCYGKLKTLTIVKSTNKNIFGGYTAVSWDLACYKHDSNAFLFSLVNKYNEPMKLKCNKSDYAIYGQSSCSTTFGGGNDLHIANNANAN